jgi:curli production assembly/transport component CsgG
MKFPATLRRWKFRIFDERKHKHAREANSEGDDMKTTTVTRLSVSVIAATLAFGIAGCVPKAQTVKNAAVLTPATKTYSQLERLPKPQGPVPVSVYNFRDQTGQYKFQENVASFSTAVTQGATSMLVKALKDSGWFLPLEREGLQDLLTERKIIRAARRNGSAGGGIRPLAESRILLEGGIVGYDTNIRTGGAGARYFGIGASGQYREDQVTVYLRAVDVATGTVVDNVSTTKTIWSQEVTAGVFRFVSFERLLELEAGFTTNEPAQLCVLEAIEKAVVSLVVEGVLNGYWQLQDPDDMDSIVIKEYLEEKQQQRSLDPAYVEKTLAVAAPKEPVTPDDGV